MCGVTGDTNAYLSSPLSNPYYYIYQLSSKAYVIGANTSLGVIGKVATYFWIDGNFVQMDKYLLLLLAIMGHVYEDATAKCKQAILKYIVIQISDYYDLEHHFDF
ncbi:16534_t:CDS:2 [Funneliformis geosporum]|uniref:16505_t:CDS:1 n=1 Tax=Funneliformis geosporum TaxID=1117311 RepID=A0A9W4SL35_9GLOM|nr:16505_t:CDS:2 [Funneliformis geosporum]CAI2187526.1 16534_t:CDS:2 [Funneliformis geosporum]